MMTMSETLAYEAGYLHGKEDAAEEIKELRKNWEFTSDLLNLTIRIGAKSMSELMAVYEMERKDDEQ